jgi:hypothetical protein
VISVEVRIRVRLRIRLRDRDLVYLTPQTTQLADHVISSPLPEELALIGNFGNVISSPGGSCQGGL